MAKNDSRRLHNYRLKGKGEGLIVAYQQLPGKDFWRCRDSLTRGIPGLMAAAKMPQKNLENVAVTYLAASEILRHANFVYLF